MNTFDTASRKPDWRTRETHEKYMALINAGHLEVGCRLCDEISIETFTYWRIIGNRFPYDRVAAKHDMLVPLRHTDGDDLTPEELAELALLKRTILNEHYHFISESLPKRKSIPAHLHLHLFIPASFE